MKRRFAFAAFLVALTSSASAMDLNFTLSNSTSVPVVGLFISHPSATTWEENLVLSPVQAGQSSSAKIEDAEGCRYDVRTVFADNTSTEDRNWDFCRNPVYDIHEE